MEVHLSACSSAAKITREKVLSVLKDSGVRDEDITEKNGTFIIKVSLSVASMIIRNRDKYPSTWVLAVPNPIPAVSVTISYCENVLPVNSGPANAKSDVVDDSKIVSFLDELKASTKIGYGVVVTFKKIDACYFRPFTSPQEILPLLKVEVIGSNEASFSEQNCSNFRDLLFSKFPGHCIAWTSCNDSDKTTSCTFVYHPPPNT
ncbi:PREDICTED: uncharacterized protein LOC109587900 [Amphimedon queenslandica]|uniref:Uncharacterized protein n=1 Tax=Amphimedon queenslandica TaxID=400682 RepID=A0A1X7TGR3_AMPQE|nr:PREDICTED: uncharacterized protein LOC109587900 [Amphimedon queenslandica]|eukprot:XP_019859681.1 PREDICTED: uncharacterized protein LOC109587900 [Amphimedon queenslandica]